MPPSVERRALTDAELADLIAFAHDLADVSGEVILPHFRTAIAVEDKSPAGVYDPVTRADREAEAALRERIRERYPEHGILGEEQGYSPGTSPLCWVLDPIDGTRSFLIGAPLWGTLIALDDGSGPVLGVVDQPYTGERYTGSRLGAWLDDQTGSRTLRTRACATLEDAVLTTTTPDIFRPPERLAFGAVSARARLTRYSGDCYGYCLLAMGMVDLVIETSLAPYDVQAVIPLVRAAGGVFTSWAGGEAKAGGQVIAAGDARIHAAALKILLGAAE